jgi:hypothetical protein
VPIGFALNDFRFSETISSPAARFLSLLQLVHQRAALVVEFIRRKIEIGSLVTRFLFAVTQCLNMLFGTGRALTPRITLLPDRQDAALPRLVFPVQTLMMGASFGRCAAIRRDFNLLSLQLQIDGCEIGRVFQLDAGIFVLHRHIFQLLLQPADRLDNHIPAANEITGRTLGRSQCLPGFSKVTGGKPAGVAGSAQTPLFRPDRLRGDRQTLFSLDQHVARKLGLGFQLGEAVLLRQPQGCSTRSIGAGHMAVPTEHRAILGDQPLAGLQRCHQPLCVACRDDADLTQAPGQRCRRADMRNQRHGALRQSRIGHAAAIVGPMGGGMGIERRFQIVAECSAERGLEASIHAQLLGDGRKSARRVAGGQHLGNGARFRLKRVQPRSRLLHRSARQGLGFARPGKSRFDQLDRALGIRDDAFRRFDHAAFFAGIRQIRHLLVDGGKFAVRLVHLAFEPHLTVGEIANGTLKLVAASRSLGAFGGQRRKYAFAVGKLCRRRLEHFARLFGKPAGIGKNL